MRHVTKYTEAIKSTVLSKALAQNAPSVVELSKEFNIPQATIHTWVSIVKKKNVGKASSELRPNQQSEAFKLQAVMDTLGQTEEEQSAYCRTHGIYFNHLETWKQQMLSGLGAASSKTNTTIKESKAASLRLQAEMKQLKSDLTRKDKALAELTALLVLKKKADCLWGESEDD